MLFNRRGPRALARLWIFAFLAGVVGFVAPSTAYAAPPGNDDFDGAVVIGALPFDTSISTDEAAAATDDPITCTNNGSVWFALTPDHDMSLQANTFGSDYDTVLSAYTGTRGALSAVPGACNDDFGGLQSQVSFAAAAGTTYYFLVGRCCGTGGFGGGSLIFSVGELVAPANDDFANATPIGSLPFQETVDTTGTTVEPGEPTGTCGTPVRSLWYSFTPAVTGSVTAEVDGNSGVATLSEFTGESLTTLTEGSCQFSFRPLTFRAEAGRTYHLRIGESVDSAAGLVRFSLREAPPVQAGFVFFPSDPSTFDVVTFVDTSFDPGGASIVSRQLQFGDGTSGPMNDCCPTHRYTADGDYSATLTVTTADGRTASVTQAVRVRTHDVAIDTFSTPPTAQARQTKQITVSVSNNRYDETVEVQLFRSGPNGFVRVGTLTQFVPARSHHAVAFPFNYTFTDEDAALGKVTFRAVATISGARDALLSDNEVVSTPTTVSPR